MESLLASTRAEAISKALSFMGLERHASDFVPPAIKYKELHQTTLVAAPEEERAMLASTREL